MKIYRLLFLLGRWAHHLTPLNFAILFACLIGLGLIGYAVWLCRKEEKGLKLAACLMLWAGALSICAWQTHTFPALDTNNTFTGTNTFTGSSTFCKLDGISYIDPANTCAWAGSDFGAWYNAAYAAAASTGGRVWAACATYNFSTPMVATTAGKPFPIEGLCQANSVSTAGLVLNYTPTTNTKAFTIDWGNVSGGQPHFDALRNVTLVNNSCATTAGCGSSASGIFIGTTNGGCPKCTFTNVNIEGFNIGFEIPSGAAGTGWGIGFNRFNFAYNATGFSGLNTSGMENLNFTSGTFIVNGTGMTTKGEVYAVGVSFDGNTTTAVNLPNNGLLTPGPDFSCFGCHFENPTGSPAVPHYITGTGNFSLYGGILEDDTSAVHTIDYMVQAQGAWFLIDGVQAVINQTGANTTITSLVSAGANVRGQVRFILGGNPTLPITYISGTTAGVTNLSYNQNTSNGLTPWKLEAPLTAPIGIGSAVFTPNATTGLHVRIPGNSIDAIRMEDTDNSKTVDCGPGIGGGGVFACRDVGGARQIWQYAYASPFLTTLAGGLATTRVATSPGIITDTIKASGTAPTCTFTSGGGTSPSCTVDTGSADLAGIIIATTGSGAPALTGTITLTFSGNYGANKPVCTYTLSLNGAGQWGALATVMDKTPAVGSDLFTWTNATGATPAGVALSTSTAYWINYNCVGK